MQTFTDILKQTLAALGWDDDEHDVRQLLRRCDELGCAVADFPAKLDEEDAVAVADTERINRILAQVDAGVTPLGVTAADIENFRMLASLDAKLDDA
jgi:hypothetical protein